ncbi:hypothetical protein L1987_51378 [Smallanthus sonchifolius]|uniref:Uncharacterized protein n=1 Tax=Smallanthus sonchifolius TaxID=185202 RepID=A0ACB9EPM8_9ASTR|nr:hypothetical protein L1987_51378 [Smallanthus sonchifolius]
MIMRTATYSTLTGSRPQPRRDQKMVKQTACGRRLKFWGACEHTNNFFEIGRLNFVYFCGVGGNGAMNCLVIGFWVGLRIEWRESVYDGRLDFIVFGGWLIEEEDEDEEDDDDDKE